METIQTPQEQQNMVTFVAIYNRLSKDEAVSHSLGLTVQNEAALEFCQKNNFKIYDTYEDNGYSAGTDERPDFQKLIADAKNKKFSKIIIWKLDRLVRDDDMLGFYRYSVFRPNNIDIIATAEDISHKYVQKFKSMQAEEERLDLSKRIRAGLKKRAERGLYTASVPYGYYRIKGKLFIDETKAQQIRKAFELFADGESLVNIRKECQLTKSLVNAIICKKAYSGQTAVKGIIIKIPAIVKKEIFDKVQARLLSRPKQQQYNLTYE